MPETTSRASAAARAYAHTKSAILEGRLAGGSLVSEGEVATALGVSRTPVREAFLRLEAEGWMRLFPKKGALVVPVAPGEQSAVLDARLLVEQHAASSVVADRARRVAVAGTMRRVLARQRTAWEAGEHTEFARLDAELHQAIVAAGGNDLLGTFYLGLQERQERMTQGSLQVVPDVGTTILDQHAELADDLERGDLEAFGGHLRAHFATAFGEPR
ncbi:GntR family transcriptional regulator [Luteimicrobium xylanilyticum]|uniref:Putative HTH-type transcriptional regulator in unstable DNA locus n=1 Tax=Luteimicrobium xylanilyticum TaxID=1133546 RepID=A0A5P9QCB5_9MICO|nr:GntR family transcriptional regulator [Luteimicrobium xylanilyticum]QFU98732.1 putative HTH-type transcriptional regulator in unstable DNA locus [Luteimicrobium xylanilyticum]